MRAITRLITILIVYLLIAGTSLTHLVDTSGNSIIEEESYSNNHRITILTPPSENVRSQQSRDNTDLPNKPAVDYDNQLEYKGIPSSPIIRLDQPVFSQIPDDISYILGTTGHNLTWIATDSGAKTYSIFRNGATVVSAANWDSGVPIVEIVDGLDVGTYNYTIELIGKFDKISYDTAVVTVTEDQPPQFLSSPSDLTYNEGTTNNILSWNISDNFPDEYIIYRNGTIVKQGSWVSETLVSLNIDGLLHGVYNFTIEAWDAYDNKASNRTIVTVLDFIDPVFILTPSNVTYAEGSVDNTLSWTGADNNPIDFIIYRNDNVIISGTWSSDSPIEINIDGLALGEYNYTILLSDINGNTVTDTVHVFVVDTTNPIFTQEPSNTSYTEGTDGHQIIWKATDENPATFVLYRNGTQILSDQWFNNAPITVDIDNLTFGIYNYTMVIHDSSDLLAKSTRFVTVTDGSPPIIIGSSGNLQYAENSTGNSIFWNATDTYPHTYTIYLDGIVVDNGTWDNPSRVDYNIDGYRKGTYNLSIVFLDDSANSVMDTIWVSVVDLTPPVLISSPSNFTYNELSVDNILEWNFTDLYPGSYEVLKNGSLFASNIWTNTSSIVLNVDGLLQGIYNFTMIAYDQSGNFRISTVWLTVIDLVDPVFTVIPGNRTYVEGDTNNYLEWIAEDNHPSTFTLYRNNSILFSSAWSSDNIISINIDGLSKGIYNYTILIRDQSLNSITNTSWVEIFDTKSPDITGAPSDFSYSEGTTGHFIEWIATDNHPATYQIFKEGVQVENGQWTSGGSIRINVDGLINGVYNYTILLYDTSSNWVSDTVMVEVANLPVITSYPAPLMYNLGEEGNSLSWTISDSNPDWYLIYRNTTLVQNGSWINGIPVTINVDGMSLGVYNFTIHVNDTDSNIVYSSVLVEVTDVPQWIYTPPNLSYNETSTSNFLSWNATDSKPGEYFLYRNESLIHSTSWDNPNNITVSIDGLLKGFYNFTLVVFDLSGNKISDQVNVTVFDGTDPSFIDPPTDFSYMEASDGNSIMWNVNDSYPATYSIYRNDTPIDSGDWVSLSPITINIDGLLKGLYNFTIVILDESDNKVHHTVYVQVIDATDPILIQTPGNYTYPESATNNYLIWNATDNYAATYTLFRNDIAILSGSWNSSHAQEILIDGLAEGEYNYTIIFFDQSDNSISDTSWVSVTDIPVWQLTPGDQIMVEGSFSNTVSWRAEDSFPSFYLLFVNGSQVANDSWFNGINIVINLDNLAKGSYNFTIQAFDTAFNYIVDTITVQVVDQTKPQLSNKAPDLVYAENSVSNLIWWNATDLYPWYYEVYNNSDFYTSGTWNNSTRISVSVDGLSKGEYNFTIYIYDVSSNNITDSILVSVIDDIPPQLLTKSNDFSYSEGVEGNFIFWNFTDSYPGHYTIFQDDQNITTGSWNDFDTIELNVDGLLLGQHNFTILIEDQSQNTRSDTIYVLVIELEAPRIISKPSETNYSEQNTTINLSWEFEDNHPYQYVLLQNGTIIANGTWSVDIPVEYNLINYRKSLYNLTMIVYDTSLNSNQTTLLLEISDIQIPILSESPISEIIISQYSVGNSISWNASDRYPSSYLILRNGSEIENSSWDNSSLITFSLDDFLKGRYNLTIIILDESSNYVTDSISIVILDDRTPQFVCPCENISYSEGSFSNILSWTAIDDYPFSYVISQNGSAIETGGWTSGIPNTRSIDGLSRGIYNFTITILDQSNNIASLTLFVTVFDDISPLFIDYPSDLSFSENSTGHEVAWTATDRHPWNFLILSNNEIINSANWSTGVANSYVVEDLSKGVYNFTIVMFDESNNTSSVTFFITVYDNTQPKFTSTPTDFTLSESVTMSLVSWELEESYPYGYSFYLNGEEIVNESWENLTISFVIQDLVLGEYNLTIVVLDESFNTNSDTLNFSVVDVTPPVFTTIPSNMTITLGSTGNVLVWEARDNYVSTYTIFRDDILLVQNFWFNDTPIEVNLDNVPSGRYNYSILLSDTSGNTAVHWVNVWIKDPALTYTQEPSIDIMSQVYEGDFEDLQLLWYDDSNSKIVNAHLTVLLDDQQYYSQDNNATGAFNLLLDYTGLAPGQYTWTFRFEKQFYETQEITKEIIVKKNKIIVEIQNLETLVQGKDFTIIAIVSFNNTIPTTLDLNEYNTRSGTIENLEVTFQVFFVNSEGKDDIIQDQVNTGKGGIAEMKLTAAQTLSISKITAISAIIEDNPFYESLQTTQLDTKLPSISPPEPSSLTRLYETFIKYIIHVIIGLFLVFSLYLWFRRHRLKIAKKNEEILNIIVVAETELKSLQSLQAIIIQSASGLPLYEVQFENLGIDSFLISGLSSAISSFLSELDKDETFGFEIMERQSISITSHKSDLSSVIVISNKRIPLVLLDQLKRIHEDIDSTYHHVLTQNRRGFDPFDVDQVNMIFEQNGFKIGLTEELKIDIRRITQLKQNSTLSRIYRQNLDCIIDFYSAIGDSRFSINELIEYLKDLELQFDMISRLVILCYHFDIFS